MKIAFVSNELVLCGGVITNFEYVKALRNMGIEAGIYANSDNPALEGFYGINHYPLSSLADFTDNEKRGKYIGTYHGWIAIFSALAVIVGGYLIDLLTLSIIFYIGSIILFLSGLSIIRIKED